MINNNENWEAVKNEITNTRIFLWDADGMCTGDNDLNMSAMAKSLHIAPSTWKSYENDCTFPSEGTIDLFCKLYHVNRQWLMTNEGSQYLNDTN